MAGHIQRREPSSQPEPLDEGYWSALLHEGENAKAPLATQYEASPGGNGFHEAITAPEHQNTQQTQDDWEEMRRIMDSDLVLELPVVGLNRGGLLVDWRSLRGFVPASQLVDSTLSVAERPSLTERVGQRLLLRVIELNAEHNRLILSERAAQVEPGERAGLLARLSAGSIIKGVITNLCDFGAFVDLGGVEGLIHISELSWGRVGHPSDLLDRGEEVEVYILDVTPKAGRVALSLKRLRPDPWESVHLRYRVGEIVEGIVTNVVDFGAFARIEEGLEGLIHVSELAEGHFLHPRNVISEGQTIRARILSIDGRSRRLGLSLRAMNVYGSQNHASV
jgi:small subunit ribosomal protein S1